MNHKSTLSIPESIAQLQRQLDQFRSTQSRRTRPPASLWQAAVGLARQHGVYAVARPERRRATIFEEMLRAVGSSERSIPSHGGAAPPRNMPKPRMRHEHHRVSFPSGRRRRPDPLRYHCRSNGCCFDPFSSGRRCRRIAYRFFGNNFVMFQSPPHRGDGTARCIAPVLPALA